MYTYVYYDMIGTCNTATGRCECFTGYYSSNGLGALGTKGDCGYHEDFAIYNIVPNCPLYNDVACGGATRGVCNNDTVK